MKKSIKGLGTLVLAGVLVSSNAFAEDAFVQVKATKLRSEPKIWGNAVADLRYGDKITMIMSADGWAEVKTPSGKKGFIHESALTNKKIELTASRSVTKGVSDDVVLAGKGFNREVENSLKASNPALNFKAVDEVERLRVSSDDLKNFLKGGKLKS